MATISRLISKIKETLKSVNKLGLAAILVAGVMALSFKADKKLAGLYYYTPATQQTWTAPGDAAPDQTTGNYALIGSQDNSCSDVNVACTYDLIDGEYVFSTRGKTSLVP